MSSQRKVAANRRNAQRSTGPKTTAGKAAVRHNALKHGLLASEVVITVGEGKESRADFDRFLSALVGDLQPVGVLEEMLVERIAQCQWRLRRGARYENAEISRAYGVPPVEVDDAPVTLSPLLVSAPTPSVPPGGAAVHSAQTTTGIDQLLEIVSDAHYKVQVHGHLPKPQAERLVRAFGTEEDSTACICAAYNFPLTDPKGLARKYPELAKEAPSPEECKAQLLLALTNEFERLERLREQVAEREAAQRELDRACLVLPPEEVTNRLTRYETAIDRQLYKALQQLERLQRRRGGTTITGDRSQVTGTDQTRPLPGETSPN